eukprot:snap_masked-scaffold_2-processed-gene-2.9-mRNA-1 protein AED:1.00 eAED:1.00 QI:0/-1/0/0/-1/1/1/0/115
MDRMKQKNIPLPPPSYPPEASFQNSNVSVGRMCDNIRYQFLKKEERFQPLQNDKTTRKVEKQASWDVKSSLEEFYAKHKEDKENLIFVLTGKESGSLKLKELEKYVDLLEAEKTS